VAIGFSLLDHLEYILRRGDEPLRGALHVRHPVLVLVHAEVHLGDVQQIPDLVHVDLVVGDLDVELQVHLHGVDVVEDVVDDARYDALLHGVPDDALHRVRLSGGRLTVCEYRSIVTGQDVGDDGLGRLIVDLLLGGVRLEDLVEQIYLALGKEGIMFFF